MIRLIATDMDGTLLKSNGELPHGFYELFHKLVCKGVYFAVASGRQYHTLVDNFEQVKEQMVFIAENGAMVMQHGKELFTSVLDKHVVEGIIKDVRKVENCEIVLCGKNSAYIETNNSEFEREVRKYYKQCQRLDDVLSVEDGILKVAVYDYISSEEHCYRVLYPKWGQDMNVIVSGKHWMDFGRLDVDKGVALKHIQGVLGVKESETLVFGDYFNDVPMLGAAYYSYAMENAPDNVKRKARFGAPSNDSEGVLRVICKLEEEGLI